ncbi:MAG: hypothetical protein RLZZ54_1146 [Cyanobacteriota bacterium]|jgi:hypothetical protein
MITDLYSSDMSSQEFTIHPKTTGHNLAAR